MTEENKKCAYCTKDIPNRRSIVNFTNIALKDSPFYFCSLKCKKAWMAERLKKRLFDEAGNFKINKKETVQEGNSIVEEKFFCKYCKSEWPSKGSKAQHESWCVDNPNSRGCYGYKKASGDEKSVEDISDNEKVSPQQTDSKPPEPKHNYCPQYEGDFDDMDKEKLPELYNEKFAILDDTILFIWKNAKILNLETINNIIQDLIETLKGG